MSESLELDQQPIEHWPGLRLPLRIATPMKWVEIALADFDRLLIDHASCERKAAATCMSFVVKYRDRRQLVSAMIELAREELEHFGLVCSLLFERGLTPGADEKDDYVNGLLAAARDPAHERFLDRLLISGIIEARSCERFGLLARYHTEAAMREFYGRLARAEARHQVFFVNLASKYFDAATVGKRLEELLGFEAQLIERLPLKPSVH